MKKSKDILGLSAREFAHVIARKRGKRILEEIIGDPVHAEINHGRWIARCPFCSGAEIADYDDPIFMCLSCFNESNGGRFIPVEFPVDHLEIENELTKRKKTENQNWIPGESLEDIIKETRDKGGA